MDVSPLQTAPQAAAPVAAPVSAEQQALNRLLIPAVQAINAAELFGQDSELTFALERGTHRPLIRLVNRKTREVIREVDPEDVLAQAAPLGSDPEPD